MSQRLRRNGSPIPTPPNTFPPSPGSNTTVATVGSPPSTGASMGTSPGMSTFSRLGPMKATVPFQLKQPHQQHHHQTALMQSNRSLHGNGAVNNSGGSNDNNISATNNNNGKFHEASSSCAPGERGGGARTSAAATSHNRSLVSRAVPISSTADCVHLSSHPSLLLLSSPVDHATDVALNDSVSSPSGTFSLPSNPSPIGNIPSLSSSPSSSLSSCLGAKSFPCIVPQAPLPPPPTSPMQQQTIYPLLSTQNNNSSMIPHGHGPPCYSPALLSVNQIDSSGSVVTVTSQNIQAVSSSPSSSSTISPSSSNPTSTSVASSPSALFSCSSSTSSSSSVVQRARLVPQPSQSGSPDQDSLTQAAAERSSPSSPAGERSRLALPFPSPSIRRTSSLDTLTGPYLAGHWPKDGSHTSCVPCMKDKNTQTPSEWVEEWREEEEKRSNHHKRSASWGSTDQLKEIAKLRQQLQRSKHSTRYHRDKDRKSPFNSNHTAIHQPQVPVPRCVLLSLPLVSKATVARFRNSVEGLNQEIERITITHCKPQEDIPDGHRAPPPLLILQSQSTITSPLHQSQTGMVSRTVDTQTTSSSSNSAPAGNHSNSSSCAQSVSPFFLSAAEEREGEGEEREKRGEEEEESLCPSDDLLVEGREKDQYPSSPLPKFSCSPKPNNSYMFQREPPEGCERVKVFIEDTHSKHLQQAVSPVFLGGPDRNKVNFIPTDSGSAFSILRKPLHS